MPSSEAEREHQKEKKEEENGKEGEKDGLIDKVKDCFHEIGEKKEAEWKTKDEKKEEQKDKAVEEENVKEKKEEEENGKEGEKEGLDKVKDCFHEIGGKKEAERKTKEETKEEQKDKAVVQEGNNKEKKEKEKEKEKEGEHEGFIDKVKEFFHDIGEKIEGAVGFGKPHADVIGAHIRHLGLHKAEIVVDVKITNPNPIPIPLVDINYSIESDGRKLVSGLVPDKGTIHAHGFEIINIPIVLIYDDIKKTYHDIKPGSIIPYKIRVALLVDVPIIGRITIPLEKCGEIPIPYKPDVDVESVKFRKFSIEETSADVHLKLENKNDFDLGLNALEYEFWLADVSVGCGELTETRKIEKQGISKMVIPISFRPKDFGSAMWEMIRGRGTGYSIKGNIDVDTPFGNMKMPISKEGATTKLKKQDDECDDDVEE